MVASAQSECVNGRYTYPEYFDSVTVSTVVFGSNTPVTGTGTEILEMDVYQPMGDVLPDRPVVIVAFGGSFISGSRADVAPLCIAFAKLGFVAVAPDYRVGFFFPNIATTTNQRRTINRSPRPSRDGGPLSRALSSGCA